MSFLLNHIALTLKSIRKEKGWSLDRTAQETGISKAMLGQIEREESNPTVLTLWKIAMGFHTSLSQFIPLEPGNDGTMQHEDETVSVKNIKPYCDVLGYEILKITLKANSIHSSCAHDKGVVEDILPLKDSVSISINGEIKDVAAGECLRFNADQEHTYINRLQADVEFYNIIHYPS